MNNTTKQLKKAYNDYTKAESSVKDKYCNFVLCLCNIAQKEYNSLKNDKDSESLRAMLKKDIIPESSSQKQRASEFCKIAKSLLSFDDNKRKNILLRNDKKTLLKNIKTLKIDDSGVIIQKEKSRDHANKRKEESSVSKVTIEKQATPALNVYNIESQLMEFVSRLQGLQSQYKVLEILKKQVDTLNKRIESSKKAIKKAA